MCFTMQWQFRPKRRKFLQCLGSLWALDRASATIADAEEVPGYRYTGRLHPDRPDFIDVFRVVGRQQTLVQTIPSAAPVSLTLHPNRQFLYAANRISFYDGLPRGTVEIFSIDRRTGVLTRLQRHALSMSGIEPRSLAITPDGRHLIVAIYGGGAYNVFPISPDGTIAAASCIFKELGCSVHRDHQASAHPHTVIVDPSGRFILASDFGCDQLNVFHLSDDGRLERVRRLPLPPGTGPGPMALHPAGNLLYVLCEMQGAVSCHRYSPSTASIESPFQIAALNRPVDGSISISNSVKIDETGRALGIVLGTSTFRMAINPGSGFVTHQPGFPA